MYALIGNSITMNTLVWSFAVVLTIVGATIGSIKRVDHGNEAVVQRFGRYHRKLRPGLNFGIIPIVDEVVIEANTRERTFDIEPVEAITSDNVALLIDAVIFFRVIDLYSAYYEIDNVSEAIKNILANILRSKIGEMEFQKTHTAREEINRALLEGLDESTEPWGVKVTRVELQDIRLSETARGTISFPFPDGIDWGKPSCIPSVKSLLKMKVLSCQLQELSAEMMVY